MLVTSCNFVITATIYLAVRFLVSFFRGPLNPLRNRAAQIWDEQQLQQDFPTAVSARPRHARRHIFAEERRRWCPGTTHRYNPSITGGGVVTWYWSLQLQTAQTAHVLAASRLSSETRNRSARWIIRGQRKHSESVTFYPIYSDLCRSIQIYSDLFRSIQIYSDLFSTLSEHVRTLNWYDLMASDSAWSSGSTDLHWM